MRPGIRRREYRSRRCQSDHKSLSSRGGRYVTSHSLSGNDFLKAFFFPRISSLPRWKSPFVMLRSSKCGSWRFNGQNFLIVIYMEEIFFLEAQSFSSTVGHQNSQQMPTHFRNTYSALISLFVKISFTINVLATEI